MKSRYIIIALAGTLLTACKDKLNILAPYKDIPVVYGLLDQNDSIHYIRVNKAYEGAGNAYTMAQVYDSINYPTGTISVQLQDYNNGALVNTIKLDTISTIPLGPGVFSYPYQVLYYTPQKLNVSDQYNLIVQNTKTNKTITGSTMLLSDLSFSSQSFTYSTDFDMSFSDNNPSMIAWNSTFGGRLYQMTIRFLYTEVNKGDTVHKSLDWIFPALTAPGLGGNYPMGYNYTASQFFMFLRAYIPVSSFITRYSQGFVIFFVTGSDDFNTYIQLSQPSLGINQDIPSFSDVKNAVGIFTSRHTQIFNKGVSPDMMHALDTDAITKPLNFLN